MFEHDRSEHRADDRRESAEPRHESRSKVDAGPEAKQHGPKHPHPKPSVRLKTDGRHFFFAPGSLSH
jgi:hypothetical protein